MSVPERIWRTAAQPYVRLLSAAIGVPPRSRSRRLQRVLTEFGCEHSFGHAAARVQEHYGFDISPSAVRETTLAHAHRASQQLEAEYERPFRRLPAVGAERVIAEADGTMICTVAPGKRTDKRPREWKEMRLAAAQAQGQAQTFYAATFGEVEAVGRRWGHCARWAGWGLNSEIHALGDGAEWIRLQTQEVFGRQGRFTCDFFHVSEYWGAAAESCSARAPQRWRRTQQARLKRGAAAQVIAALAEHLEPATVPDEAAPVRNGHRYPVEYTFDYAGRMKPMKTWQNFTAYSGAATTTWNYSSQRGFLTSKRYPPHEPFACSATVPAASPGGVPPHARQPGEDACATIAKFMAGEQFRKEQGAPHEPAVWSADHPVRLRRLCLAPLDRVRRHEQRHISVPC